MIFYEVVVKRTKRGAQVGFKRDLKFFPLANFQPSKGLVFLSSCARSFWDEEDEANVLKACTDLSGDEKEVGTLEVVLELKDSVISLMLAEESIGTWTAKKGLRFTSGIHPVFRKDKDFLAQSCADLPSGTGGIFKGTCKL